MDFAFSPLDRRYREMIPAVLSEEASFSFQVQVEAEWLKTLRDEGICPDFEDKTLDSTLLDVSFARVEEIEKRTQHATRALVEAISEDIEKSGRKDLANWVHVGLTSFDVVDTASRLRLKSYMKKEWTPLYLKAMDLLRDMSKKHCSTLQTGRTHGQWAVPTYFGLSLAEAWSRLADVKTRIENDVLDLRGQSSGAIGGYHASGLLGKNPLDLEEKFLNKLGLKPNYGSTQILPPEDIASLAHDIFIACSVFTKLANDWRHLARSEIAEVYEEMKAGQVGSSTMPQKKNPWNMEHICSLYKVLKSKLALIQEDMITEHQRDLTNSASGRFYFEFFAVAHLLVARFMSVATSLQVDLENMQKNFDQAGFSIFAEAIYVELTKNGVADAHHIVREASRKAEATGKDLLEILKEEKLVDPEWDRNSLMKIVLSGSQLKLDKILK
ncbi:MAG: lyase family protein [Bdellovibrionota bacterium]